METFGNKDLLKMRKVGFLASRKISTLSILPTLDWALKISKQKDIAIVSGFHSKMERDLLGLDRWHECDKLIKFRRSLVEGERRFNYLIILLKSLGRA